MTPGETRALADVRGMAAAGRVRVDRHAERRMYERGATHEDVIHALMSSTTCTAAPRERWRLDGGSDCDGESFSLVVVIEWNVIVVTLF